MNVESRTAMVYAESLQEIRPYLNRFFINGKWEAPIGDATHPIIDPSSECEIARCSMANQADVFRAVEAARSRFESFQFASRDDRLSAISRFGSAFQMNATAMSELLAIELGAPIDLAKDGHCDVVLAHVVDFMRALSDFRFEERFDDISILRHEPIGVCGLITPWNWPPNQIALKVLAALAAGCTMVLKPSEVTPMSAALFAKIVEESDLPPGVFNMVQGTGPEAGSALVGHPDVAMVSFTGSTRAGKSVAALAAQNVTRVATELGGKSANILFEDIDLPEAVQRGVTYCFENSGQSCDAPTRMFVQRSRYEDAVALATTIAENQKVGPPCENGNHIGPLVNSTQFDHVQTMIQKGISEGARLVTGGLGRPVGHNEGYYARPTVFADVSNEMAIAQEEIFGPVLVIIPFDTEEEAIRLANESQYGLAAYVESADMNRAARVASKLRVGTVRINGAPIPDGAPFGGYKASGVGREGGRHGIAEFQQVKTVAQSVSSQLSLCRTQ